MGGVDPWFDDLDEKKVSLDDIRPNKTGGASHSNHQSPRLFIIFTFFVYTLYYFNRFFFPVIVDYDDLSLKYQINVIVFVYLRHFFYAYLCGCIDKKTSHCFESNSNIFVRYFTLMTICQNIQ